MVAGMLAGAQPAEAASSGWMHPTELHRFSQQMNSRNMMPVKVACRGDSRTSHVRDSMQINMTFAPNPRGRQWRWVWGSQYGSTKSQLERQGWKLVSSSSFTRPQSGLRVRCGIFHAP